MKLVMLGTGGYFPNGRRHTACFMLPEVGVVLDAGTGMANVAKHLQTNRLDVFLTHAHLDHIIGLTYLVNLVPPEVIGQTTVHGAADKLDAVRDHLFAEAVFPLAPPFKFAALNGACALPNGGQLQYFPLLHPGGSVGFRLDWPGHSLAYVTDTTASADATYSAYIHGVDLLIHEAYFPLERSELTTRTGHSALQPVVELAAASNVGRLVIVHIDPQLENDTAFDLPRARRSFAHVELGLDGLEIDF